MLIEPVSVFLVVAVLLDAIGCLVCPSTAGLLQSIQRPCSFACCVADDGRCRHCFAERDGPQESGRMDHALSCRQLVRWFLFYFSIERLTVCLISSSRWARLAVGSR